MKKYFLYGCTVILVTCLLSWKGGLNDDADVTNIAKVYSKYALDDQPRVPVDTNLIGIWKMQEDSDPHNYFVIEKYNDVQYVFTYMNREGSNRVYENMGAFSSNVNGTEFINATYLNWKGKSGYFLLKVIDKDKRGFDMTLAMVADTTLKDIGSSTELRDRISKNINNPAYFKKPVHFRKILPLMYCR